MGANSKIEWTDRTWNPITGCTRVSAGCDNCYAVTMTKRLEAMGQEKYTGLVKLGKEHFNGTVKCHEDTLLDPLKWRKPQRIFVNSMSDVFHKDVPFEFIDKIFAVMALCPHLTFQVLTKRPERACEWWNSRVERVRSEGELLGLFLDTVPIGRSVTVAEYRRWMEPLPNVWVGTSIENQATADERIPHLLSIPAKVRFLSGEPLLGPVDLKYWLLCPGVEIELTAWSGCLGGNDCPTCNGNGSPIHWVIVGGESGANARPMHPDWARSLRDQCVNAGVPFFFKQWGEYHPRLKDGVWPDSRMGCCDHLPSVHIYRDGSTEPGGSSLGKGIVATNMKRVGKRRAGRLLNGRTWDEFPEDRR